MTGAYTPACPACRNSDPTTFYAACGGCQARKAHVETQRRQPPQPTKDQVEGMDSTMHPLEKL